MENEDHTGLQSKDDRKSLSSSLDVNLQLKDLVKKNFLKSEKTVAKNFKHISSLPLKGKFEVGTAPQKIISAIDLINTHILKSGSYQTIYDYLQMVNVVYKRDPRLTLSVLIHKKGESIAYLYNLEQEGKRRKLKASNFNKLFNMVKKSKKSNFESYGPEFSFLNISGNYVSQVHEFKFSRLIYVLSRNEFLPSEQNDEELLTLISSSSSQVINAITLREGQDLISNKIKDMVSHLPFPIKILDRIDNEIFSNQLKTNSYKQININNDFKLLIDHSLAQNHSYRNDLELMISDLLETLKHELSNPLFGLSLSSDLMQESIEDEELVQTFTEIQASIGRCQSVIRDFSNLYASSQDPSQEDIRDVLGSTLIVTKSATKDILKDVIYRGFDNEKDYKLLTRSTWLSQVLFNLILNSSYALTSQKEKKINIIVTNNNLIGYTIIISDNGPGIEKRHQQNLFQPFFTTRENGHGLGLAISKELIEKLGGTIEYKNTIHNMKVGGLCGANFILTLPKR